MLPREVRENITPVCDVHSKIIIFRAQKRFFLSEWKRFVKLSCLLSASTPLFVVLKTRNRNWRQLYRETKNSGRFSSDLLVEPRKCCEDKTEISTESQQVTFQRCGYHQLNTWFPSRRRSQAETSAGRKSI